MQLISYTFIVFFICSIFIYYMIPKKIQFLFLLLISYVFYGMVDCRSLIFIITTTITIYIASLKIEKLNFLQKELKDKNKIKLRKRTWLIICIFINIFLLFLIKYFTAINNIFGTIFQKSDINLLIPLGISFYTLQSIGYLIDVYNGKNKAEHNVFKLALFISFFPQLIQGPINRFKELSKTLFAEHKFEIKNISNGLMRIAWGFFKKLVIADRLIIGVSTLINNEYAGTYVFVAMLLYAFEIYCDFTGGIDICIGVAETMGIKLAENFNLPYFSKSVKEYWNRWHISLGAWFKDYVYYPLSTSSFMLKITQWSRKHLGNNIGKRVGVYISCLVVWILTGLWHGFAWNFVAWGFANYIIIMVSRELQPLYRRFHKCFQLNENTFYNMFQIIRTIVITSSIRMFDCYQNVFLTLRMLKSMITNFKLSILYDGSLLCIGLTYADFIIVFLGLIVVLLVGILKTRYSNLREKLYEKRFIYYNAMFVILVFTIVFGIYGNGYDASYFIYNQF